jgi:hypothetical protein
MLVDKAQLLVISIAVGADENCDTAGSVNSCPTNRVTAHVRRTTGALEVWQSTLSPGALARLRR